MNLLQKTLLLASLLAYFLVGTKPTLAHGGPPFIRINGNSTIQNPVYSSSIFFKIPNEKTSENYLVNQKINFNVDTNLLPVDPSVIAQSEFTWDFGDGTSATNLESSHAYSKPGSFIVILKVKDLNYGENAELESVLINILPKEDYQLPSAVIKVNGQKIADPLKEPVVIKKNQTVKFDASSSVGKIKSYKWDFGDGSKLYTGVKVEHKFDFSSPYTYSIFPILRIEDEKGFISDSFVQISNDPSIDSTATVSSKTSNQDKKDASYWLLLTAAGLIIFAGISFFIYKKTSKTKDRFVR